jgi:hypothetical protein
MERKILIERRRAVREDAIPLTEPSKGTQQQISKEHLK